MQLGNCIKTILLLHFAQDAMNTGMGILQVEHGILLSGLLSLGDIKLQVSVGRTHQEEETGDIRAHFVHQFIQRDKVGFTGAHLERLPLLDDGDKLVHYHVDLGGIVAQCLNTGKHIGVGINMVGPEYVDAQIIPAV